MYFTPYHNTIPLKLVGINKIENEIAVAQVESLNETLNIQREKKTAVAIVVSTRLPNGWLHKILLMPPTVATITSTSMPIIFTVMPMNSTLTTFNQSQLCGEH